MIVLGLNYLKHESSAALVTDGKVVGAVEAELLSRSKFDVRCLN